ncbi:MAG: thymidine kinase [Verrucomicrobia bacterium]|nr:thymidine kinase [Verrucomicrobiota bacterium]MDE3046951.1 thymidine kinase [Verrucomicrobiota bacterium]
MAKLYFRHGTVGSAKTLNLLAVAHNYRQQGKKIILMKPDLDTRFGKGSIKSRAGLSMEADVLIVDDSSLKGIDYAGISCILVDEAQFLSGKVIEEFRRIALEHDIPVLCYGLRTDFKSRLFEGSQRLLELADSIEEVKATCHYCNRKSIMNLKHVNGLATNEGPSVELGCEEKYFPTCYKCYRRELDKARIAKMQTASCCGCKH